MDRSEIENALRSVKYPGFSRDIVSFGLVREVVVDANDITVKVEVTTADSSVSERLDADIKGALAGLLEAGTISVEVAVNKPKGGTPPNQGSAGQSSGTTGQQRSVSESLGGVKHIVAVASGKGGVGKSTFSTNLACALEQVLREQGKPNRVGLLDCDVHGPSVPLMMGVSQRPTIEDDLLNPLEAFGVKVMSMGLLVDDNAPVVWRGPMVTQAIQQFFTNVRWGDLEVLVIDLPPGTGDAQLTLAQTAPIDGAVIVTTPQAAAVSVAARGAQMFGKVNVPIIGVVENMSYLEGADGSRQYIFGKGGGEQAARALNSRLLGQVPLDPAIREGGDSGVPVVVGFPKSPAAQAIRAISCAILNEF